MTGKIDGDPFRKPELDLERLASQTKASSQKAQKKMNSWRGRFLKHLPFKGSSPPNWVIQHIENHRALKARVTELSGYSEEDVIPEQVRRILEQSQEVMLKLSPILKSEEHLVLAESVDPSVDSQQTTSEGLSPLTSNEILDLQGFDKALLNQDDSETFADYTNIVALIKSNLSPLDSLLLAKTVRARSPWPNQELEEWIKTITQGLLIASALDSSCDPEFTGEVLLFFGNYEGFQSGELHEQLDLAISHGNTVELLRLLKGEVKDLNTASLKLSDTSRVQALHLGVASGNPQSLESIWAHCIEGHVRIKDNWSAAQKIFYGRRVPVSIDGKVYPGPRLVLGSETHSAASFYESACLVDKWEQVDKLGDLMVSVGYEDWYKLGKFQSPSYILALLEPSTKNLATNILSKIQSELYSNTGRGLDDNADPILFWDSLISPIRRPLQASYEKAIFHNRRKLISLQPNCKSTLYPILIRYATFELLREKKASGEVSLFLQEVKKEPTQMVLEACQFPFEDGLNLLSYAITRNSAEWNLIRWTVLDAFNREQLESLTMYTQDGQNAILMERVYGDEEARKTLVAAAKEIGEKLGIPVFSKEGGSQVLHSWGG